MRRSRPAVGPASLGLLGAIVACGPSAPAVVRAPVAPPGSVAAAAPASGAAACGQSWRLEDVTAESIRVLVVCAADVRRVPVNASAMARALDPGLALAQQRVCACAARMPTPATFDLVVTAAPSSGSVRVEPSEADDADESLDASAVTAFRTCVGSFAAAFPPYAVDACEVEGESKATYVYALSVELGGASRTGEPDR
jgi:hypothetical protein